MNGLPPSPPSMSWPPMAGRNDGLSQVTERPASPIGAREADHRLERLLNAFSGTERLEAGSPKLDSMAFQVGDQRVTFLADGRVLCDGTPDEAAKIFWKAVEASWPEGLKREPIRARAQSEHECWVRLTWARHRDKAMAAYATGHDHFRAVLEPMFREVSPYVANPHEPWPSPQEIETIVFSRQVESRLWKIVCEDFVLEESRGS